MQKKKTRASERRRAAKPVPRTAPARAAAEAGEPRGEQPLYLKVARELERGIVGGTWPVGARLPTELELCERFGISRFTARAAVRVLSSAGLIKRRQRVGTVVIATPDEARYSHDAASLRDLMQYAIDTELRLMYVGKVALDRAQAREFGAKAGDEWIYGIGVRHSGVGEAKKANGDTPLPFCLTRLYLNPVLKGIEQRLRERKGAIYSVIESDYNLRIERVEQDLQAVVLGADDAANLGAPAGAPALRIVRRYYDDRGRLLEVADNVHPSDRFTYHMQLRR